MIILLIKRWASALVGGFTPERLKLTLTAALVAVTCTSVYACHWERRKHDVAADKVTEARKEVRELQAHVAKAAIAVQEAQIGRASCRERV